MSINIYSNWFSPDKSLFYLNSIKNVDVYIDNINIIHNNNYKIIVVVEPKVIYPRQHKWILDNYMLFNKIITYDEELLQLPNSIKFLYGSCWVKQLSELKYNNDKISFIIGNKNFAPGHSLRHSIFYNQTNIHKKFDTFISTRAPIQNIYNNKFLKNDDKTNLFYDYAFHLSIENSRQNNYFTEKIIDCFQTMTVPIYWGCPNISQFFDIRGIIILDTNNIEQIINIINSIDLLAFYKNNIESIKYNYQESFKYLDYQKNLIDIINKYI